MTMKSTPGAPRETTELKEAKAEIKRLNEELEERVERRTRELTVINKALRTEVAERKLAEESVKKAEDRLRLVIDTIPTMAWSVEPDGTVDFVNQRWLDYTGVAFEDAIADPQRTVHPDDISRVVGTWEKNMAAGELYEEEMRLRRADGKFCWFLIRTAPLRDESGKIVKWFGTSTDIEDRKGAEDALRQSEFDLAEAQRVARIGSWSLDLQTDAVRWSEELYRIFDVERSGFGGAHQDFLALIWPDDRARVLQTNVEAKATGKPFAVEYRIKTQGGQWKDIRELGFARKNEAGVVVTLFGTAQDITERKRAEKELEEAHRQLKILSRRRLKVQEEERRHLARELHDEIGQALTAATINLQATIKESNGVKLTRVAETALILEKLLGQVRQISLDLRPSMLDHLGLVPALRALLDEQGRRASVAFQFSAKDIPENLDPEIQTSCYRIVQEAITNAVRHAHASRIDVDLKCENGNLRVEVRDDGTGFDVEAAQAQTTGLGLIGIMERATLVNASARIISSPNGGTMVEVSVPLGGVSEPPDREPEK